MAGDLDNSDPSSALIQITRLTIDGRAALADGDGPGAFAILSRKHRRLLDVFPRDSASAGTSFIDLAEALHLLGNQKEAREAIDNALAIFKRLDRKDKMRDRLERTLIDICKRQGHSFVIEELLQARTTSVATPSSEDDLKRAMEQDELAMMFFRRRDYDKALPLLLDSKNVFERAGPQAHGDLAVCCQFLSRVYLHTEHLDESVTYGRQAADYAARAHGDDSLEVTMARDELAVALGFSARRDNDPVVASEAVALSESSAHRFTALQGLAGKEATRSWENNRRLKQMLGSLLTAAGPAQAGAGTSLALPTFSFISHAYSDREALNALLKVLPKYVKPVVFEAIDVPPTDFVSEKLISGVLDAEGLIFIDSDASSKSFWCAFERDLAARKKKHMFRFDPRSKAIEPVQIEPRELKLAHCFHAKDAADVQRAMRWLVDERSFAAFHDDQKLGDLSSPPFATMPDKDRQMRLFSLRTFGSVYLIFLSNALLNDNRLCAHVVDQMQNHPRGTVACWLHPRPHVIPKDLAHALSVFPDEHVLAFSRRPTDAEFSVHLLDDLSVRLFWVHSRIRGGDWTL